jgi:hypothetical protein
MLRLVLAIATCAGVALVAVIATWLRTHVVPPDCEDPMTLAQVHRKLTDRLKLPLSVTLDNIRTHAGGYFAFRFACEADLHGINPGELPPGTAIPGGVGPWGRTGSGGYFDRGPGVLIFELHGAQVTK